MSEIFATFLDAVVIMAFLGSVLLVAAVIGG